MTETCFHCAELIPPGTNFTVRHGDTDRHVCCAGCQAVAQLIIDGGNQQYYQFRDGPAARVDERALQQLAQWKAFDQDHDTDAKGVATLSLLVGGMHCGACGWLIETRIGSLPGVTAVDVDVAASTAVLHWVPSRLPLSDVLATLVRLGFQPHPLEASTLHRLHQTERAGLLRRLAVSGLGMMQVMMFAVATYAGAAPGMDPAIERLLLGVSMLVATPVVFYAGAPFLVGALRALSMRSLSMDVPIAIALLLAYGVSCVHFFTGGGATYFESVSMFVFFLLCSRLVAMLVRHRAFDANLALASLLPDVALRLHGETVEHVRRQQLKPGDLIRVRAGDAVPADGVIVDGQSTLNEALLSGESTPTGRGPGDAVLAGSVNVSRSLTVQVTQTDAHSAVARTAAGLAATRAARPRRPRWSERVATPFVLVLLIVALSVGGVWLLIDPTRALGIVLAVLVVTCPCALSLAMPTALSAAATRLARSGLLVQNLDVFEVLDNVRVALFDKTGTLSVDRLAIESATPNAQHLRPVGAQSLIELAGALEAHSTHPIASAFVGVIPTQAAADVVTVTGRGLTGTVGGRQLRVGSATFAGGDTAPPASDTENHCHDVFVADQDGLLGTITLRGAWRDDARALIARLQAAGVECAILSGDHPAQVARAVRDLGLDWGDGHCLPEQKLARLRRRQETGQTVMAVGDGVNDAAFLAGADVSVAIASGADLAQAAADIVLTGQRLQPLAQLPATARLVQRIVRQNLAWAIGYNVLAVPMAACGIIGPGLAALGMSASSLVVVLNSARLARRDRSAQPAPAPPTDPLPPHARRQAA